MIGTRQIQQRQDQRLLTYLMQHGSIDPITAWRELGIYRLSAAVFLLRAQGQPIETENVVVQNRFGEDCRVARYVLSLEAE